MRMAFLIDTCRRSAPTGFTTKSVAPARIAEITVSIEPCAVCTMTGLSMARSRICASTPMPSRSGITRSRITTSISLAARTREARERLGAIGRDHGLVAEAAHHRLEQAALDGIIVHDQNGVRHRAPRRVVVLEFRFGTILLRTGKGPINANPRTRSDALSSCHRCVPELNARLRWAIWGRRPRVEFGRSVGGQCPARGNAPRLPSRTTNRGDDRAENEDDERARNRDRALCAGSGACRLQGRSRHVARMEPRRSLPGNGCAGVQARPRACARRNARPSPPPTRASSPRCFRERTASAALHEAIARYERLDEVMGRLMSYVGLVYAGDTSDPVRAKLYGDTQERHHVGQHPCPVLPARAQPARRRGAGEGRRRGAALALSALARGHQARKAPSARGQARTSLPREIGERGRRLESLVRRDHGGPAFRGRRRGAHPRADAQQASGHAMPVSASARPRRWPRCSRRICGSSRSSPTRSPRTRTSRTAGAASRTWPTRAISRTASSPKWWRRWSRPCAPPIRASRIAITG